MHTPPRPLRKRWWFRVTLCVVIVYAAWLAAMIVYQDRLVFPGAFNRNAVKSHHPSEPILTIEGVPVWCAGRPLPSLNSKPQEYTHGVAILFHGNDETAASAIRYAPEVAIFARAGWTILAPEYPGFGGRPGRPSEAQIAAEAAKIASAVTGVTEFGTKPVYIGYSLGGGAACAAARRYPPSGLILRNTFTSISDFAWSYGVPPVVVRNLFDNRGYLQTCTVPVLLVHAQSDQIVPLSHGRALSKVVKNLTYAELAGDHFGFDDERLYATAVEKWLATNFPPREAQP